MTNTTNIATNTRSHRATRTWRSIVGVVPLVLPLVLVAACAGGGDSTDSTDSTAPATTVPDGTSEPAPDTTTPAESTVPAEPSECPVDALPAGGEPVEIVFWHAMSATTGVVIEELIADYNATQSRVHVTPVFQGGYEETYSKFVNTLRSGGDLPTIVQLSEISLQPMVDSRSIVTIDDCVAAAGYDLTDFPPVLLDQYRVGGELVTMPFQLANPVLFYDGNDFVAAGLDPDDPPDTLEELVAVSETLVGAGVVTSGISLEVDAWSFEQWVVTAGAALVDSDNGRTDRAEHAQLDSAVVTEVLTTLADLHDRGLLLITGRGGDQAGLARFIAIAQGEASMTIASSASLGEIYQQIARVPDVDVRVGPFPGSGGKTSVGGGSLYLTADATDAERAAAWDLMAWLNEPVQQVRWSIGTGYVPTRLSAVDDPDLQQLWAERPGFRVAWDQLATPGEIPGGGGPVVGDYLGVRDAIEDGLEALYAGTGIATVQADMQRAADEAIADYNRRIG